jgi:hypothetical protein
MTEMTEMTHLPIADVDAPARARAYVRNMTIRHLRHHSSGEGVKTCQKAQTGPAIFFRPPIFPSPTRPLDVNCTNRVHITRP